MRPALKYLCSNPWRLFPMCLASWLAGCMSTQPQKSFLNKANTTLPNSNQNTRKSKSFQPNFTWTILEEKPTTQDQLFAPWKRVKESPFLPLLGDGWTLPLSASSMGLRYYTTQSLKTAPLPRKHQGSIPSSLTHSLRMLRTLGPALLQYLHKGICPAPAAILFLSIRGALHTTLYGSSIFTLVSAMH